jgi:peptidoglycan/LPS O-acetylase OafA/YrhL
MVEQEHPTQRADTAHVEPHSRIDLPAFWFRRARRLLPALICMLITTSIVARFGLFNDDRQNGTEQEA